MEFSFLKFKKEKTPALGPLHPPIFDVNLFWFSTLGLCLAIFLIAAFIGGKMFYSQYFETYKDSASTEDQANMVNVSGLNAAIQKRNDFLDKETPLPRDPSL